MTRINYTQQAIQFLVYVMIQLPLLYKYILFDRAIGFFYVGFLLLVPYGLNSIFSLIAGFMTGLLIDIFSNTPGIHASACTLIMFVRDYWLRTSIGVPEEDINISIYQLGFRRFLVYSLPLVFIHHLLVFSIEHGTMLGYFKIVMSKVFYSTLLSFISILLVNYLIAKRTRKV
ncbi:MAG: hypothetical protein KI790_21500 [Cyclobacteriaceae bacterium]|nr:hypothetical protein [Cyclobacteriaceae bacterium HetDA_MAG_MS6]